MNKLSVMTLTGFLFFNVNVFASNPASTPNNDFCNLPKISFSNKLMDQKIFEHVARRKGQASVWESKTSGLMYIIDAENQKLVILDRDKMPTLEKPITINVGKGAIGVIANKDDSTAFVTNRDTGTLDIINVKDRKLSSTVQLKAGARPFCQIFGAEENRLYIVTKASEAVYVVDTLSGTVVNTIGVKDLSTESQLTYCYSGCHKDRRHVMLQSINNKPEIPDMTIKIPAPMLRNTGLRQDYVEIFKIIAALNPEIEYEPDHDNK